MIINPELKLILKKLWRQHNLLLRGCCTERWAGATGEFLQSPGLTNGSVIGGTPQPGNSELFPIGDAADHQLHGPVSQLSTGYRMDFWELFP